MLKTKPTFLFFLSALIFFFGCASKRAPGGGPVDKTPPEIIATFPTPDSIGIKELSVIEISFSESINESSIANSVFISPPLEFDLEWQSDVDLEIHLKDSLKDNQTYVIVIGSSVKDLRNNKLAESMQLAFSTGDKIDRGIISGKVYGLKRKETYSLFAFELFSDTISFDKNKPNYISQTGDEGKYFLNYMKLGNYRVFAVNDQNNNLKIDSDFEKIGIPYTDVLLDSSKNTFSNLNFRTTKIDTTFPKLTTIRPISNRQINLRLSEQVILKSLNQIEIRDSITSASIQVLAVSENIEANNTLELYTSAMDSGSVYLVFLKSFSDSSLNMAPDTSQSFIAAAFKEADTFKVITVSPKDSLWNARPAQSFYFEVNNPLDKQSIINSLVIKKQNGDSVKGKFTFPSAYETEFTPNEELILDTIYTFQINYATVKNVWGDSLQDTILTRHIKINNGDDYGEISGQVKNKKNDPGKIFVTAKNTTSKKDIYSGWTLKNNKFLLKYVTDGHYKLSSFLDVDSNSVYSAGHLYPFQFSEPFVVSDDTTKVRKRWETSGVELTLPSPGK
ncbi:MAG: hypothetical protein D8M58_19305 [Calditrichaeota bacterium]|nr:MAG: hypothetical protein DWQ03_21985 [Calditrichota bacterium]MBL1207560.1 hypothetical protein [Calditrichota bacterium]NOG47392.1 Ig-like domain-containing protein [Calditrichota bacterium]